MYWISGNEKPGAPEAAPSSSVSVQKGQEKNGSTNVPPTTPSSKDKVGVSGAAAGAQAGTLNESAGGVNATSSVPVKSAVTMSFVGDVIFASKVEDLLKKNGWDYPYQYAQAYLDKADITVANLETPISRRGTPQAKEYVYRSSPEALPAFKAAGFDLVNTSNNHIMDYGQDALLDTLDELDKAGIKRVGTGRNSEEAYKHVIIEQNGIKVAFLGFSRVVPEASWYAGKQKPGVAETYSTKLPLEAIAKAREEADLVVVIAHWGVERTDRPVKEQTDLAHKYIDQGADLVIASHPHVLQGFEQYKGKWIAYSLGNFIFTTNTEPATWESMILNASCTKERACDLQMIPMLNKYAQPVRMTEEDGVKLFEKMSRISVNASVDKEGKVSEAPAAPVTAPPAQKPAPKKPADTGAAGVNKPPAESNSKSAPATTNKSSSSGAAKQNEQQPSSNSQHEAAPKKQP